MEKPKHPTMRIIHSKFHRLFFPSFIYKTSSSHIHLTFDDGPHPVATPSVLKVLKSWNVKATFFLLGKNVQSYPGIARQVISEGHAVGNHTFDHPLLFLRSKRFIANQLGQAEDIIVEATAVKPKLFRPPYGFLDHWSAKIVRQLGYQIVLWTTDPADFESKDDHIICQRIVSSAQSGSIILLHDNDATANKIAGIVDSILDSLTHQGFTFASLQL